MHNEQLIDIRGEEEMEMSDDDMEDSSATNSKDSEDLGKETHTVILHCNVYAVHRDILVICS